MTPDSFTFNGTNSMDAWGVRIVGYDVLTPAKRPRKTAIPRRHGQYDHGADCWEERIIRMECALERRASRAEVREMAWILSQKGQLRLWNEPDKFYIAELFDPAELTDFPGECMRTFDLRFTCEPFAYTDAKSEALSAGDNALHCRGAVPKGCTVTLTNPNHYAVSQITITSISDRTVSSNHATYCTFRLPCKAILPSTEPTAFPAWQRSLTQIHSTSISYDTSPYR